MKINPKKLSKAEVQEIIKKIFSGNPDPKMVRKAKHLAMSKNIKLGSLRKKFCKKCYTFFKSKNHEVRIKKPLKIIKCKNCGYISRYKIQNSLI
jgi:RNase P subunit RPR2